MYIVTGGTQGIGRSAARLLAEAGETVLVSGRDAEAGAAIEAEFPGVTFRQADVAEEGDCAALVAQAMEMGKGRIRGLVNNAGIGGRQEFAKATVADWDRIMSVNARGSFMMCRLALDGLIAARGVVVNVASIAGRAGEEELAIYTASKAAVIGMTQALALELGHLVRFNAVCPGQIATRMMERVIADDRRRRELELRIPAGRLADPAEVGEAIVWLLSDQASYVNGSVMTVDGGETAGLRKPRLLD